MKLISLAAFLIYLTVKVNAQQLRHEQFPFPPQFPTPSSAVFPSDSSLYLPPESHSPMPYFPMKNLNNLQFQYLPPTGTKAPQVYPTPFPMMLSSLPSFDDDEEEDEDTGRIQISSPQPPRPFNNRTQNAPKEERKEPRMMPKTVSYRHPIDRADMKFPFQMGSSPAPNQTPPASRRMIISAETTRTDQLQDQVKTASYNGLQYIPAPPGFLSSTTEPAIPILRLSNEMDLDGSYSYEALGADQTHYVQHSRMENMGTEKEEQVVEGSYSYVGDNGQTFTVHYVADGNGFRASGDHLPVAPPVPEIIQRSIQYNLAEEARRPAHLKHSWEDEAKEHELSERVPDKEKNRHHFALSSPPRNLFTGKQPEAFSYSYGQGANQEQVSSLVAAASNNVPVKTVDFSIDQSQSKSNSGPISPQITFLASQGAHLPSMNAQQQQQQQSISRMFVNADKPSMTQLMNYEATPKETELENNKSLWRWQYGLNANNESPPKNSISRSFGEGDDVMINFNDMNQEQYTNMIRSQIDGEEGRRQIETPRFVQVNPFERNEFNNIPDQNEQKHIQREIPSSLPSQVNFPHSDNWYHHNVNTHNAQIREENQQFENDQASTLTTFSNLMTQTENNADQKALPTPESNVSNLPILQEWHYKHPDANKQQQKSANAKSEPSEILKVDKSRYMPDSRANLVTSKHFTPPSQTVTQSYDYDDDFFEVRKLKSINHDKELAAKSSIYNTTSVQRENLMTTTTTENHNIENEFPFSNDDSNSWPQDNPVSKDSVNMEQKVISTSELPVFTSKTFKFSDFISHEEEKSSDFKPIFTTEKVEKEITTTETSVEDMFNNNIFLKNLVRGNKPVVNHQNAILEEPAKQTMRTENRPEPVLERKTKHIVNQTPFNELKVMKQKPFDISDMLNYISTKNHFDSGKVKAKKQAGFPENQRKEMFYPNIHNDQNEKNNNSNKLKTQQHEELRGIIKNYKILQRNNNMNMNVQHNNQPNKEINLVPYRIMQVPNLPPLGRAGPAAKSYLPPIYV